MFTISPGKMSQSLAKLGHCSGCNVIFFLFKWLASFFPKTVCPGQKKKVNEVTDWNLITYYLGRYSWRLYNIKVVRNGLEASCATPLDCTWIVEEQGIYQEDDTENRCKFV